MIEFKNVTKHYGNNVGLENATVRIEKRRFRLPRWTEWCG